MSFRDKVGKGLAGIALAGAVGLSSGCAPHARHLYNTGQINEAQFEQMRAEEERQSLGTLFGILGGSALRSHGLKTGNLNQAIAGEALTGYGIAKAGQGNTNVYVDNGSNRNNSKIASGNNKKQKSQIEKDIESYGSVSHLEGNKHRLLAYKGWNDLDNDGAVNVNEIYGIGDVFEEGDSVNIYSYCIYGGFIKKGQKYIPPKFSYFLMDTSNGDIVDKKETMDYDFLRRTITYPPGYLKQGNYRVVLNTSKGSSNSIRFQVIENL